MQDLNIGGYSQAKQHCPLDSRNTNFHIGNVNETPKNHCLSYPPHKTLRTVEQANQVT